MKVSFSRKGFDSGFGGQANAILPDGTLLPFPIPSDDGYPNRYDSLFHNGISFFDIISSLKKHPKIAKESPCHLDPDLRRDVIYRHDNWQPAFGQADQSLSELFNNNFGLNDLFLFFGWFKETEYRNGRLQYKRNVSDMHLIYGYMQVGHMIQCGDVVPEWLASHPHAYRIKEGSSKDAIFLSRERLSFAPDLPGAGMLHYAPELVLTAPGMSRSRWELPHFFNEENVRISHSPKQPEDGSFFQSTPIGQEMIWEAPQAAIPWLQKICGNLER